MKPEALCARIASIVLAVCLLGASVLSVALPDQAFSESEKRALAQSPALTLQSLTTREQEKKFSDQYEKYVADQFPLRDSFVALKSRTEIWMGKQDLNGVFLARDNYLIAKSEAPDSAALTLHLKAVQSFFEKAGELENIERTVCLLAPDSGHIYPDKLPRFASVYDFSLVTDPAKELFNDDFCDAAPLLDEHRAEDIYYRTDHHWTSTGAYYAYRALSEKLGFTPHEIGEYDITEMTRSFAGTYSAKINLTPARDTILKYHLKNTPECTMTVGEESFDSIYDTEAPDTSDAYRFFLGGNFPLVCVNGNAKNGKTLLVIKDSYANSLVPFLTDHYETIFCIDYRYYHESALALCKEKGVNDVLVLYQATNFAADASVRQLTLS